MRVARNVLVGPDSLVRNPTSFPSYGAASSLWCWRPGGQGGAQEGAWWTGWASGRSPANDRGPLDGSTFVEPNPLAPDKTTKLESIDDLQPVLWTSPAWALVPEFFLRSAGLTGLAGGGGAGHTKRRCSPKPQVWVPLDLPW